MLTKRRNLWRWWPLLAALVAVAGYGLFREGCRRGFRPAPFTPESPQVSSLREAARGANIVLIVIDAARADHTGCYGYPRDTTPNIDRLASSSVLFERHFCQSTDTKSSTASLLTSQYCDTHLADGPRPLLDGTFTWERGLEHRGFRTALFSSNLKASPVYGIGEDFQHAECDRDLEPLVQPGEVRAKPEVLIRAFRRWLEQNRNQRFFAYLHFLPPHSPYFQPDDMTQLFAGLDPVHFTPGGFEFPERVDPPKPPPPPLPEWINLYDANLRYADWGVGELEKVLSDMGLLERSLLIITSDHGEAFGEHGHVWHGRSVHEETAHIPLLVRFPGNELAGSRIPALTQTVDLLPTIFDLLEVPYPQEGVQGRSLLPLLAGATGTAHDYAFCRAGGDPSKYLVRSPRHALILYGNGRWRALYDLEDDPGQRKNVIDHYPEVADEMAAAFGRFAESQRRPPLDFLDPDAELPPLPPTRELELTPEQRQQLRNLGYLR